MKGAVAFAGAILFVCAAAAGTAAILNLDISGPARFLILLAAVLAWLLVIALGELSGQLGRLEYWLRLTFISVHLRNEADGLAAAHDRLNDDLSSEREQESFRRMITGPIGVVVYGGAAIIFAVAFLVILQERWFGPFAIEWPSQAEIEQFFAR